MYYADLVEEYFCYKQSIKQFPKDQFKLDRIRKILMRGLE